MEGAYEEEASGAILILYTKDGPWEPAGKGFRVGVSTFEDGRGPVSLQLKHQYLVEDSHIGC